MSAARLVLGIALALADLAAYEFPLTARAITDATTVARSATALRQAFHRAYRLEVNQPPVDYIEVVTPYRRVEIAAEVSGRLGQGLLSQREALARAEEGGGVVEFHVEMTFHPLNTLIGVPDFAVTLRNRDDPAEVIEPRGIQRIPRFGPRVDDAPVPLLFQSGPPAAPGGQPLTGGTVIATFGVERAMSRAYDIVVRETGSTPTVVGVDLGGLR